MFSSKEHTVRPQVLGYVGVFFLILSGSTYPVFGKQLTGVFSATSLLFLSEVLGGIFVAMFFGIVPIAKKIGMLRKHERIPLLLSTLLNSTVAPYLWFVGLHKTTAINAELFSRAEMLFMILLSIVVLRETFTKRHFGSLSCIIFGLLFVGLRGFTAVVDIQIGDLYIIGSALTYACGGVVIKKYLHGIQPEIIILTRAAIATCMFALLLPFTDVTLHGELRSISLPILGALFGYTFISKFLGVYGFYQAIDKLQVRTVSMAGTLTVVGGMIFASIYLGEHIHWYQVVGGICIVLGVLVAQKSGIHASKRKHEHHIRQHHRHHI